MLNIGTKHFLFITLSIVFIFSVPHFSTSTFAQKAEVADPLDIETLLGDTVETQHRDAGQHEIPIQDGRTPGRKSWS